MQYIDKGFLVWIIPSTFLSHEAVNWVLLLVLPYLLSLGFTLDFRFIIIILYYNCLHPALPLVFYSTSLLLFSYYTMHVLCLWSFTNSLLAPVCLCSWYGFQYMFMIRIYRYASAYLCTPLDIRITTRWEVLTPLDPHVQVLDLGACGFSWLLIKDAQR